MYRTYILGGLAAASLLTFTSVHADEQTGVYVGASIGEATDKVDEFEDSGTTFKIMGGHSFNRYFAAELAYIDAGNLRDRIDGIDVTVESTGIVAAVLAKLPLGDYFSVFAKLGYAFYEEKVSLRLGDLRDSKTNSADDPLYGIGGEFRLGQRFKLRAEYEVVDIDNADFDMVSVGTTFHF
jgi:opacity protein-like surface antigen